VRTLPQGLIDRADASTIPGSGAVEAEARKRGGVVRRY
jgi:hypothetical protein